MHRENIPILLCLTFSWHEMQGGISSFSFCGTDKPSNYLGKCVPPPYSVPVQESNPKCVQGTYLVIDLLYQSLNWITPPSGHDHLWITKMTLALTVRKKQLGYTSFVLIQVTPFKLYDNLNRVTHLWSTGCPCVATAVTLRKDPR